MKDIEVGAHLIVHMKNFCENCHVYYTPQWRKGWYCNILKRNVLLCNACGLKYSKNQYCFYCKAIYGKNTDKSNWLSCKNCGRYVHSFCVISNDETYVCSNCC